VPEPGARNILNRGFLGFECFYRFHEGVDQALGEIVPMHKSRTALGKLLKRQREFKRGSSAFSR